jgi:hypothetical protein
MFLYQQHMLVISRYRILLKSTLVPDILSIVSLFHAHFTMVPLILRLKHYFPYLIRNLFRQTEQLIVNKLIVMTRKV